LEDEECFDLRYMNNTDKKRIQAVIKEHNQLKEYAKKGDKYQTYTKNTEKANK
jgi:hypothetical protein